MTDQEGGESQDTAQIDHDAEFERIRTRISGLGDAIRHLNTSADELLRSADSRTALAVLDPPAEVNEDDLDRLESSMAALGRHAANLPDEFDPTPLESTDPDYPGESSAQVVAEPSRPDVSEPAFGDLSGGDRVEPSEPSAVLEGDDPDEQRSDSTGAQVFEFVPRGERGQERDSDEPAFGALSQQVSVATSTDEADYDETPARAKPAQPPETELAFGALPEDAQESVETDVVDDHSQGEDGLDAIATTESTDVASQWDGLDQDTDAFDKFFSNEVEPEPAQRWLLNE